MQDEIAAENLPVDVYILGLNEIGQESGNALMPALGDIPWLQDVTAVNAWDLWNVTYRDVVILDREQAVFATYNLTTRDLANPANYAQLKQLLRDAANAP